MIEAVGEEYWPTYFATLNRLLAPGGRVGLQAITMPHDRMVATRHSHNWIHKYVFPGGQLLSVPAIEEQAARGRAGDHRAPRPRRRLRADAALVARAVPRGARTGSRSWASTRCSERLWDFYLAYCEAGFRSGYLDVWQFGIRSRA